MFWHMYISWNPCHSRHNEHNHPPMFLNEQKTGPDARSLKSRGHWGSVFTVRRLTLLLSLRALPLLAKKLGFQRITHTGGRWLYTRREWHLPWLDSCQVVILIGPLWGHHLNWDFWGWELLEQLVQEREGIRVYMLGSKMTFHLMAPCGFWRVWRENGFMRRSWWVKRSRNFGAQWPSEETPYWDRGMRTNGIAWKEHHCSFLRMWQRSQSEAKHKPNKAQEKQQECCPAPAANSVWYDLLPLSKPLFPSPQLGEGKNEK